MGAAVGAAFQDAGRGELAGTNFFALAFHDIISPGINSNDNQVTNFLAQSFGFRLS
jgi:hypothetical protein